MKLTDEKHRLEYLLSPRSLKLHKEYEAMTEVLRKLGYIDSESMGKLLSQLCIITLILQWQMAAHLFQSS